MDNQEGESNLEKITASITTLEPEASSDIEIVRTGNVIDGNMLVNELFIQSSHKAHIGEVRASDSHEEYAVTGHSEGTIVLWNHNGEVIHQGKVHDESVVEIEIYDAIYSIGEDNRLIKTNVETFDQSVLYTGTTKGFTLSSNRTKLAIYNGSEVIVFSFPEIKELTSIQLEKGSFDIRFSSDGQYLYNAGHEGEVAKYSIETGELVKSFIGLSQDVKCIEVAANDAYIVAGATNARVAIWDNKGNLINLIRHAAELNDVAISEDQSFAASVGADKTLKWIKLENGQEMDSILLQEQLATVSFINNGMVIGDDDNGVYFIGSNRYVDLEQMNLSNVERIELIKSFNAHEKDAFHVALSHDGQYAVTSSFDKRLRVWNIFTEALVTDVQMDELGVDMLFTNDDSKIIYKGEQGAFYIYDFINQTMIHENILEYDVGSVALTHDNKYIAIGDRYGTIRYYEFETMMLISEYTGLEYPIFQLEFSKDESMLFFSYAGSTDNFKTAALDVETFELLYETEGHTGYNYDVKTASEVVITSGADSKIIAWDISTGEEVLRYDGHRGKVMEIDVLEDETMLVSASAHGRSIGIFDMASGEILKMFDTKIENQCIAIAPDESFFAVIGEGGELRIYGIFVEQ
jgi:WD40 repeat protein